MNDLFNLINKVNLIIFFWAFFSVFIFIFIIKIVFLIANSELFRKFFFFDLFIYSIYYGLIFFNWALQYKDLNPWEYPIKPLFFIFVIPIIYNIAKVYLIVKKYPKLKTKYYPIFLEFITFLLLYDYSFFLFQSILWLV